MRKASGQHPSGKSREITAQVQVPGAFNMQTGESDVAAHIQHRHFRVFYCVPELRGIQLCQSRQVRDQAWSVPVDVAVKLAKDTGWGGKNAEDLNVALVDNPDVILIDVRTAGELAEKGVVAVGEQELIAIPLEEFVAQKAMWPADRDAEIVVYCGSGHRSTMAMAILLTEGYTNVTSLKGGFGGWVEAGFPVAEYAAP